MKANKLLLLSIVLNLGLVGAAAYVFSAKKSSPIIETKAAGEEPAPEVKIENKQQTNLIVLNAEADEDFTWRAIETADFKIYIANLRSIHCPEETIRDIIVADVNKLFAARMRDLRASGGNEYWKARDWMSKEDRDRQKQMTALQREKSELLVELLGVDPEKERRKEEGYVDYFERQYAFLPEEKQKQVRDAQEKFEEMRQEIYRRNRGMMDEEDQKKLREIYEQQLAAMSQFLSPAELEQYELRTSQVASQLRYELDGFLPSEEEFRAIYKLRKERQEELQYPDPDDKAAQERRAKAVQEAEKEIEAMFGAERFAEYKLSQDHAFKEIYRLTERFELPREKAVSVYEMKKAAEDAVKKVRDDKTLDKQQRDEALKAIRTATEEAIAEEVGKDILSRYRNRGGWWINNLGR